MLKEAILSIILCCGCLFSIEASSKQCNDDGAGIILCQAGDAREESAWPDEGIPDSASKEADTKASLNATPARDTAALSDDDIIMIDEDRPRVDTVENDTVPPIEKMPELKKFVEADYPERIYKQGIEGAVLMELLVSDSGVVDSVSVIKGIHPDLDSSAIRAVRRFIFIPAMAGGVTVPVLIQYEYRFELKEIVKKIEEYVNLKGMLIERGTKKPIADAMVVINFIDTLSDTTLPVPFKVYLQRLGKIEGQYLEEDRLVTITDSSGSFQFYSLPSCTVEVSAPLPGYEDLKEREFITPSEETTVNYYIRRISYSDYEIVVYGKVEEKEVSRRQITLNEVKKIPGLGGDAVKVVQAMPGVARPAFGSGQIIVRGAPSWDSQFYLDGVLIPQLYHFGGIKSIYPSDALQSVNFYPGGFGTRYGNVIAGVIEIEGRKAKNERMQGYADVSFMDGSFMVESALTKKKNVSLLLSARRSFIGDLLKLMLDNSNLNFPYTVSPFYWDYLGRLDVEVNKKNKLFFTSFGSKDRLDFIIKSMQGGSKDIDEATDRLKMELKFHMFLTGWDFTITDRLKNSARYSFTNSKSYVSPFGFMKVKENTNQHTFRDQLTCVLRDELILNTGVDFNFLFEDLILMITNQGELGGISKDTSNNWRFGDMGAYVNLEWRPSDKIVIIPGFRYDYYPELKYKGSIVPELWNYKDFDNRRGISGEPSLRITGKYEFVKKHMAKLSIGTYNQTPQPIGQVIHKTWGDPYMPATKSAHYVLGYEWQITDLISLDLQGYMNRQWDVPRLAVEEDSKGTEESKIWYDNGKRRMKGLELMLRYNQSERFFGWLAYTLSHSEEFDIKRNKYILYGNDETHHIQLIGSWHLKRDWDVGFRLRYVTGKPETPIDSSGFVANNGGYYEAFYGLRNSERVDPFFQLDLRVDKKFVFDKWIFSLYLDMQNLSYFAYKSPEFTMYNYDYSDKMIISNIFIPALGYRAEF